ncbi:MAG: 5-methylcytosine-specific restriction enzyme subunit McrC [Clostridiales bacterium]|jgi:5-methylcytosine-specific restriction enzyme subunit McrC|nr:5-methylcytosine-specific restriction enzyme subunit McrC [Clostridiales bacterium]
MNQIVEKYINENESIILNTDSSLARYIEKKFSKATKLTKQKNEVIISTNNVVGVIKAGNMVFRIYPKVDKVFKIFKMIEKISLSDHIFKNKSQYIYFDPKEMINIERGNSLVNQLIDVFINELEKVRNIGYTKTYNRRVENSYFLRGKLLINKHIRKNLVPKKFYSSYNQLDYGTYENFILFSTLDKLIKNTKLRGKQNEKLLFYKKELDYLLKEYDYNAILSVKNGQNNLNRINVHYENLLNLCDMFLNSNFYSSINAGKSLFCNFLIKTDIVFERYIFLILKELIESEYTDYYIEEQVELNYIRKFKYNEFDEEIDNGYLKMKPDIVIYKKETKSPVLVIDTKYIDIANKNKLSNNAYYQIITYVISLYHQYGKKNDIDGILLAHGERGNSYKFTYDQRLQFKFYTEAINLFEEEIQIKNSLRNILNERLGIGNYGGYNTLQSEVAEERYSYEQTYDDTLKVAESGRDNSFIS